MKCWCQICYIDVNSTEKRTKDFVLITNELFNGKFTLREISCVQIWKNV